ncbi:hypothetical protein J7W19_22605 [Streptomyces mobaraensis NBRC 13819 = DSM 40847]|uniref:Uncharacterized protein n=1 Tax=Streptomyces mobaraensis (strain ATCC 29032 / DSM 40847 / JCM 4168 / NBRC 13819 / NCIMB 11159 / IPCR 16-22) TaxID=1223523 RepID=M3A2Q1_STRM1|nr:hypothetical protein [Streptomyces mobaraensis]EME99373.1 hypothetical protein H340_16656 [Streptomyces mobaraensis NBRC 13819 = DSM 40847]QTT75798.1 hypothetical protein J7W19_22605 [Streptomyces mobaraensis NBRC 13819 = DSM 40847]
MSEGRRRTRPWGPLRGPSGPARELADLQRAWLDKAGLRVRDLAGALQPEHFTDGRVPARSTVSDRLAGANPRWDFVEAVADVCSRDDAERSRLLDEARPVWERVRATALRRDGRTGQRGERAGQPGRYEDGGVGGARGDEGRPVDCPLDDCRSGGSPDDPSRSAPGGPADEALRAALDRAAEAERARDGAHQLSVLLLTTVGRLEKDLDELRARGGADGVRTEQLRRAHRRLQRSEARRTLLAQELRRVRAERDALRRASLSGPDDRTTGGPVRTTGGEARTDPPDNRPDNRPDKPWGTPGDVRTTPPPDNSPLTAVRALSDARAHGQDTAARHLATTVGRDGNPGFVQRVVALLHADEQPADAERVLTAVARTRPAARVPAVLTALFRAGRPQDASHVHVAVARAESAERVLEVVAALREAGLHSDVYQILMAAGRLRALGDVPPLVRSLESAGRSEDARWLLGFAARERPRTEARALAEILRLAGVPAAADHLLAELRPAITPHPEPTAEEEPPPLPVPTRGLATVIRIDPSPGPRAPILGRRLTDGPYVERVPPPRG